MTKGSYDDALAAQVRARADALADRVRAGAFGEVAPLLREVAANTAAAWAQVAALLREGLDAEGVRRRLGLNVAPFPKRPGETDNAQAADFARH